MFEQTPMAVGIIAVVLGFIVMVILAIAYMLISKKAKATK